MRQSILSLSLVLLLTVPASAYKQQSIDINVNGQQRNMVVFTPNTLPAKSPLFIVTHGMNQSPEYQYGSDKMYQMIDKEKFVVAYLRSDGNTWDTGGTKDQNFVEVSSDCSVSLPFSSAALSMVLQLVVPTHITLCPVSFALFIFSAASAVT